MSVRKSTILFSRYSLGLGICSPVYLETLTTHPIHIRLGLYQGPEAEPQVFLTWPTINEFSA